MPLRLNTQEKLDDDEPGGTLDLRLVTTHWKWNQAKAQKAKRSRDKCSEKITSMSSLKWKELHLIFSLMNTMHFVH